MLQLGLGQSSLVVVLFQAGPKSSWLVRVFGFLTRCKQQARAKRLRQPKFSHPFSLCDLFRTDLTVESSRGFEVSRFRGLEVSGSEVPRFRGSEVPRFRGFEVSRFGGFEVRGFEVPRFRGFEVSRLRSRFRGFEVWRFRGSRFRGFEVSRFQVSRFQVSRFRGLEVSRLRGFKASRLRSRFRGFDVFAIFGKSIVRSDLDLLRLCMMC